MEGDDGWVALGGRAKLVDLVESTAAFDVQRREGGGVYIRLKPKRR